MHERLQHELFELCRNIHDICHLIVRRAEDRSRVRSVGGA
jgi:hypothetical protein